MDKERRSFDCLFLHDTQMSDIEREQILVRSYPDPAPNDRWLPRTCTQAFCPSLLIPPGSGKLIVKAPVAVTGWIVRPVILEDGRVPVRAAALLPTLPHYPPFPGVSGFILGHADPGDPGKAEDEARKIIEWIGQRTTDFSVNVWYEATLSLDVEWKTDAFFSVTRTIGKPAWKKNVTR